MAHGSKREKTAQKWRKTGIWGNFYFSPCLGCFSQCCAVGHCLFIGQCFLILGFRPVFHLATLDKHWSPIIANPLTLYRGQNPQNREKRVSGSKNSHFRSPQKRAALSPRIPIFLVDPCREMGIFGLKAPFSGAIGNGSFLTPKPSFPDFGDFDPCRGSADKNCSPIMDGGTLAGSYHIQSS